MENITKRLLSLAIAVVMVLSMVPANALQASAAAGDVYTLVTDASTLQAGDQVVIVASGYDYALSTTQNTNNRGQASVTKSGNTVTFGSDVQILTLEAGTVDGTWAFNTGSGYLYAAGGTNKNNYLKTQEELQANGSFTITISNGEAVIKTADTTVVRHTLQYNQSSSLFACYASGQKAVSLYKLSAPCEHASTVAVEAVAPTCTETGLTAGTKCADCGYFTVQQEEVPALGHTFASGTCTVCGAAEPAPYIKASDIAVGDTVIFVCEAKEMEFSGFKDTYGLNTAYTDAPAGLMSFAVVAGKTAGTVAFKNGDEYLSWSSGNSVTTSKSDEPSDTSSWNVSFDDKGNAVITNAADSTRKLQYNASSPRFACYTSTQTAIQLYKECTHASTVAAGEAVEATCTAPGMTAGEKCSVCGKVTVAQEEIPALNHSWGDYVYNKDATVDSDGTETATCTVCSATDERNADGTKGYLWHCICGANNSEKHIGGCDGTLIEWKPWNHTDHLPTENGNWYLVDNVTLTKSTGADATWRVNNSGMDNSDLKLDLNGKTINAPDGKRVMTVYRYGTVEANIVLTDSSVGHSGKMVNGNASNNEASMFYLYNYGGSNTTTVSVYRVKLDASAVSYTDINGGAIRVDAGHTLNLYGVTLNGCTTKHGSAIYGFGGTVNVKDGSVINATGSATSGGAIWNGVDKNGTVGVITIEDSTVNGAEAVNGGAIYNTGTLNITGSTVNGGKVTGDGGAIWNNSSLTITNSTINAKETAAGTNVADNGGAIFSTGTVTVTGGKIIAGHVATSGGAIAAHGGMFTVTDVLIDATGKVAGDRAPGVAVGNGADVTFTMNGNTVIKGGTSKGPGGTVTVQRASGSSGVAKFIMNDGQIIGGNNTSTNGAYGGGNVRVTTNGQFFMNGGSITGGTATNGNGGVVLTSSGTMTISGDAKITGNDGCDLYLNNRVLTIADDWQGNGNDAMVIGMATVGTFANGVTEANVASFSGGEDFHVTLSGSNAALGAHAWTDADCDTAKTCSVCKKTEGEALGHTEVVDAAVAATCTTSGLTEGKHCSVCEAVLVAQGVIPAKGHSYEAVVTAPDCVNDGYTTHTCSVCFASYVDSYVDALGHTEVIDAAVEATCTETGLTEGKHCDVCGEVLVAQEVVKAKGHSYTEYTYNNDASFTQAGTMTATCDNGCGTTNTMDDPAHPQLTGVAELNGQAYETLQAAINAAGTEAAEIKLIADFALSESVKVANGQTITLDLNGHTITGTDDTEKNFGLIHTNGDLTINDSFGDGKITLTANHDNGWNRYSSVISNNPGGKLTVNAGTLEHLGGTSMAYAIDNLTNGKGTYAETVINGGTVTSAYIGVRQFLNGVEATNKLTINGGTVTGGNSSIYFQSPSANANTGTLVIGANAAIGNRVYLGVTQGATEWPVEVSIAAEALAEGVEIVSKNVPEGYEIQNNNGIYGVVEVPVGLEGEGTEANPFLINSLDDLIFFRDSVNSGDTTYNAPGVYVALGADIDMGSVDWSVNIGDDCNATFDGIFDGKDHTIFNLNGVETAAKSDKYICAGLFGAIYGSAVIKNLTIENVDITVDYADTLVGHGVGAVVGFAYAGTGSIENVTVCGDININAPKAYAVGTIVGYAFEGKLTIKDCVVDGEAAAVIVADSEAGSAIVADSEAGGIIGYCGGTATVTDCSVQDLSITADGLVGGIAGIILPAGKVADCSVNNVDLTASGEYWGNSAAIVAGTVAGNGLTVSGTTYSDVTAGGEQTNNIVGSSYAEKPTETVPAVAARIGDVYYLTLAAAVNAAEANDVISVIADIANEAVTVDKSITITGAVSANNVSINTEGGVELTVSGLSFTGNSWINAGGADKLTVSGVTANVTPSNATYTNSRSAFISLGRSEQHALELVVENCNIVSNGGSDPILGWSMITGATISGNTFGSAEQPQENSDSIKFMAIAEGAVFNITGNTVYSNYNGIVFAQNTTRGNAYTANISGNTFVGGADHVWIEVSGANTTHATINASGNNTVNGEAFQASDIKVHPNVTTWTSYAGVDVVLDSEGKVVGGTLASFSNPDCVAEGYVTNENGEVVKGLNGTGTAEDPYQINNLDDLKLFRDLVNAGNTYAGQYIKVTADIDLNGEDWEPIGTKANPFKGNFDGGEYTISNLVASGEAHQGLFGYADACTIKNVKIHNAKVTGTDCVGAVAGEVYSTSTVDNCHVSGRIEITGYTNVGGILGKYYAKVSNCSVIGDGAETSFVKGVYLQSDLEGDNIGGIMGHCGENNTLTGNTVKNITVSGTRKVGGIVGIADQNTDLANCVVDGVVIETTATADYATSKVTTMSIGGLIGQYQAAGTNNDGTVTDCAVSNVTFVNANNVVVEAGIIVGGARGGSNGMLAPSAGVTASGNTIDMATITGATNTYLIPAAPVATVNGVEYTDLNEALKAAVAVAGGTVTVELLDNIDLTGKTWEPVYFNSYIASGTDSLTIDGNGYTITGLSDMLFSSVWTGTELVVKDLTIDQAAIYNDVNDTENKGVGAIVGNVSAIKNVTLNNVHLTNSHVEGGHWTGGFFGYIAGYSGNDGPVFTTVSVENCSVEGSVIVGKGSVGGVVGHATGDAWTTFAIAGSTVTGNTITSTGSSTNKAGIVAGTIGAAGADKTTNGVTMTGGVEVSVTESGNTATSNGTVITTVYGRQGSTTGALTVTGGNYEHNPIEENVSYAAPAEGYQIVQNADGSYGLAESPKGSITIGYTSTSKIWGEATANAKESFVIEIYAGDTLLGTTTLNNIGGIIDGDLFVTWNAPLVPENYTDPYWTAVWNQELTSNVVPTKVVLIVDGVAVSENVVQMNGPDNLNKVEWENCDGVKYVCTGLKGEGTAADPYKITRIEELKWFRDDVNAGNNYNGKYIELTADIDLADEEWTPIGYMGKTFKGNFSGGNHTIKNLTITKTTANAAENNGIGLFGRTDSPAVIRDLTIENVDITGSLYVGAVVGYGYTGNLVENVTVKGDIAIDAWWYAGVIGGNGYMSTVNDCHVIGNDGSYIKGNSGSYIGGIWGFRGEGGNVITNCSVENLEIIGVDRVGGICGIGHYGNTIADCTLKNVTVTATDPEATTVGLIVGACQGNDSQPTVFEDNTMSDTTAQIDNGDGTYTDVTDLYGTNIDGSTAVTNYVAKIGGAYYESLTEAIKAAEAGDTVTLLADVALEDTLTIEKSITLDGNGHKLTPADSAKTYNSAIMVGYSGWGDDHGESIKLVNLEVSGFTANYGVIRVQGVTFEMEGCDVSHNTVLNDSYSVLTLTYADSTVTNSEFKNNECPSVVGINYNNNASNANITIDGCTFEENTCSGAGMVFHNTSTTTTVKNSLFKKNTVGTTGNAATLYMGFGTGGTVTGCTFEGNQITTSHATTKRIASAIFCDGCVVSENVFGDNTAIRNGEEITTAVAVGAYYGEADISSNYWGGEPVPGVDYTIEYSSQNVAVKDYYADAELTEKVEFNHVAKVGKYNYSSLAEAFAAAKDGDTVTLLANIDVDTETYTIADGVSITLDMNGKKITVADNATANYELFYIFGEMTVTGNGTIEMTATNNRYWNAMSAIFHNRGGVLTIENGSYTHNGGTDMAYVVDNSGNYYGDATTSIKDGTLSSAYIAIRNRMEQNSHGASGTAILNVSGGTITGTSRAIWAQAATASTTSPATGVINVTGGKIGLIDTARHEGAECMTTISGGTVAAVKAEVNELTVTGGTVGEVTILTAAGEATDYTITDSGLYTYAVAQVNGVNYATLQAAIDAAGEGDTVKVLCDIALDAPITVAADDKIVLELNGKTVSYTSDVAGEDLLTVSGELTINDSIGGGKLSYTNTDTTATNVTVSTISAVPGANLVINGGTIENNTVKASGSSIYSYAIDILTNGNLGDVAVTINDGTVTSNYMAIRQFVSGTTCKNSLTVNGGTIVGTARAVNVQVASNALTTVNDCAELTITGGTFEAGADGYAVCVYGMSNNIAISGGSFIGWFWDYGPYYGQTEGAISGGSFNYKISEDDCAEGFVPVTEADENGMYTVRPAHYVAQIEGGKKFESVTEALAAAQAGDTVVLLEKVTVDGTETWTIPAGVTLSLPETGNYAVIVKGDLTMDGEGTVHVDGTYGIGLATSCTGGLTVNGDLTFTAADSSYYTIGAFAGKVTVNGGDFSSPYCVINSFDGYDAEVEINGGTFKATGSEETAAPVLGTNVTVNGGYYSHQVPAEYCAEGYLPTVEADENGLYTIQEIGDNVAQNLATGKLYTTATEALQEAYGTGATIQMIADSSEFVITVSEGLTLDLNGKTLTVCASVTGIGAIEDSQGTGLLKAAKNMVFLFGQEQLPIWNEADGYIFLGGIDLDTNIIVQGTSNPDATQLVFRPIVGTYLGSLLADGAQDNGLSVIVRMSWDTNDGGAGQDFDFKEFVDDVYGKNLAFYLTINNFNAFADKNPTFTVKIVSDTLAELASAPVSAAP